MLGGRQPVVHHDAENGHTRHAPDVRARRRRRQWRSLAARREDDLLRLVAVEPDIIKIHVIFGVRFERRKVDKKANLHEN